MEEVYKGKNGACLYVGSDEDFWRAKARDWPVLTCAKEGPHGHRSILGYKTPGAPKGKDYYSVQQGNHMALNLIDADDPALIPAVVIDAGLKFIDEQIQAGKKMLVQCNKGHSRGPSMAMIYLRSINDLPDRYHPAFKIFKTLYPKYDPNLGMEHVVKQRFKEMRGNE